MKVERETAAPGRTDRPTGLEIRGAWNDHSRGRSNPGGASGGRQPPVSDRPRSLGQGADAPRSPRPATRDTARHDTVQHGIKRVCLQRPGAFLKVSDTDGSRQRVQFAVLNATNARETPHSF